MSDGATPFKDGRGYLLWNGNGTISHINYSMPTFWPIPPGWFISSLDESYIIQPKNHPSYRGNSRWIFNVSADFPIEDPGENWIREHYSINQKKGRLLKLGIKRGWYCHYCRVPLLPPHWIPQHLVSLACSIKAEEARFVLAYHFNPYPQMEHIIPHALGGTDRSENLLISCSACNMEKGATFYWDFVETLWERQNKHANGGVS